MTANGKIWALWLIFVPMSVTQVSAAANNVMTRTTSGGEMIIVEENLAAESRGYAERSL